MLRLTPQLRSLSRLGHLRVLDALTLCAIAAVVLLVSLPRLREFALRENQSDAEKLVTRLGALCEARQPELEPANIAELLASSKDLMRQLDDVELLDDGGTLRRHGYLFELAHVDGRAVIHAWPWRYGHTGLAVYGWIRGTGAFVDANALGTWSGLSNPPPLVVANAGER